MAESVSIERMADEAAAEIADWHRLDQKVALAAALEALEEYLVEAHPDITRTQRGWLRTQFLQQVNRKLAAGEIKRQRPRRVH
jgi:hypothetical protein